MRLRPAATGAATAALALAACGGTKAPPAKPPQKLTGRQQDSVARAYHHDLGESGIPGVSAIGKAQRAADTVSARMRVADTIH
ncbi:MAG: hypothetical protein ACRENC_12270 [Gemmatimonadaceae bacterium]